MDRLTTVASPMYGTTGANYAYNVLDDLVHVNIGGAKARNQHYCYDTNRHLRTIRSGSCSGSVVTELDFDLQGNLESREPAGGAEQGYRFDYGNRLREVDGVERYRYDGHGRRVLAMNFVSGTVLSQYGLDGRLLYQKSDRTGLQTDHVYPGSTLVAIHERPASGTGATPVKYQHTDGLGSPVVVTRQDRSRAEESEYEPYGQVLNRPMRDGPGYTGHVEDAATGLVYMQQRYYDPMLGVFLSVDPVTAYDNPISQFHRYRYANNNPYSLIDPDGRRANGDDQKTTGSHLQRSEVAKAMLSSGPLGNGPTRAADSSRGAASDSSKPSRGVARTDSLNHTQSGIRGSVDQTDWRIAASVQAGRSQYVDSPGPIIVQPGSTAGPLPTNQFYYLLTQRPLLNNGGLAPGFAAPDWSTPVLHSSGGTGIFDRAGYLFEPLPGPGSGGTRWYIRIHNGPRTHNNAQHPYLNVYVPVDR